MNATLVSISKKYAFLGDTVDYQIRVKLGSGEKITNSTVAFVFDIADEGYQVKTFANQTISAGGSKTYSFSKEVIPFYFEERPEGTWYNILVSSFDTSKFVALEAAIARAGSFRVKAIAPSINGYRIRDNHPLNPLEHFGAFVQNRSILNLQFDAAIDSFDPRLTAAHKLLLTAPDQSEREFESADGVFTLASPSQSGTYTWVYTVTDSAGNGASESGSFEVLAYAPPRIDTLAVQRYTRTVDDEGNPVYNPADDGERIRFTIDALITPVNGLNAWTLSRLRDDTGETVKLLSGEDGERVARADDHTLDGAAYSAASTIGITLILSDFFETVERYEVILKAGGYLHVTKTGTAVGMRSTATPLQKKFEVAEDYAASFYGGIDTIGIPGAMVLLDIRNYTISGSSIADGADNERTITIKPVEGADAYYAFPRTSNYGVVNNLSFNQDTMKLSVSVRNLSGGTHTTSGSVWVAAFKRLN